MCRKRGIKALAWTLDKIKMPCILKIEQARLLGALVTPCSHGLVCLQAMGNHLGPATTVVMAGAASDGVAQWGFDSTNGVETLVTTQAPMETVLVAGKASSTLPWSPFLECPPSHVEESNGRAVGTSGGGFPPPWEEGSQSWWVTSYSGTTTLLVSMWKWYLVAWGVRNKTAGLEELRGPRSVRLQGWNHGSLGGLPTLLRLILDMDRH